MIFSGSLLEEAHPLITGSVWSLSLQDLPQTDGTIELLANHQILYQQSSIA